MFISLPGLLAEDAKLTVEDIVERHLASIGTPEARAAAKNRLVSGTVQHSGGFGEYSGNIIILSEGWKLRYEMNSGGEDKAGWQLSFDGDKVFRGLGSQPRFIRPIIGASILSFVYDYQVILKEGLLGGTLSTAWPLLDLKTRQAKLNYNGLKKIEGRELHEVQYQAKKGGGEVKVHLYFDPENFRHVRTQYRSVTPAIMSGIIDGKAEFGETTYTLIEQFDNFQAINGLMLPQFYGFNFPDVAAPTSWNANFSHIIQNQQIDPEYFTIK